MLKIKHIYKSGVNMVTVEEFGKEKYEEGFRKGMWKGIKETKFEIAKRELHAKLARQDQKAAAGPGLNKSRT